LTAIIQKLVDEDGENSGRVIGAWAALVVAPFLYFLIYLYLDVIIPDTYGINKKWNFCLKRTRSPTPQTTNSPREIENNQRGETEEGPE